MHVGGVFITPGQIRQGVLYQYGEECGRMSSLPLLPRSTLRRKNEWDRKAISYTLLLSCFIHKTLFALQQSDLHLSSLSISTVCLLHALFIQQYPINDLLAQPYLEDIKHQILIGITLDRSQNFIRTSKTLLYNYILLILCAKLKLYYSFIS